MEKLSPILVSKHSLLDFSSARSMWTFALSHIREYRQAEFDLIWNTILKAREDFDLHYFLREYVWCVHVSGFNAKVVANLHPRLMQAHGIEDASGQFLQNPSDPTMVLPAVLNICKNQQKANAIQKVRWGMHGFKWGPGKDIPWINFAEFKHDFISHGRDPSVLTYLPYIGPALSRHLARNLGNLDVFKPDLHLVRLTDHYGFKSVKALLVEVGLFEGEMQLPFGYIDLVLWIASVDHGTK